MDETGETDVASRVRAILDEVLPAPLPGEWAPDRPLTEAGLDSVGVVTMIGELEARFGISLAESDLSEASLGTLDGIVTLVRSKRSEP